MTLSFTRRRLPLSLLALTLSISLHSQTAPASGSQVPSTYETDPAVDPARPTVTNPAHIPPPGYLQFEQGFLQANGAPGGPDSQLSVVQTTKLSLNHHLMLIAADQPFARTDNVDLTSPGIVQHDTGDLLAGAQIVLLDEGEGHSRIPTLAASYIQRVRSGTAPDLDAGSYSRSFLFLASGNLPFNLHYDTNYLFNQQQADDANLPGHIPPRRLQYGQTLSVTHTFIGNLSLTGEIWRFSRPLFGGNAIGNLWTLGYSIHKTIILDTGFSRGLTPSSTRWETFAGVSYLLPHRLWPLPKSIKGNAP